MNYIYYNITRNNNMRNGYRLTTVPQESSAPPMEMKKCPKDNGTNTQQ